MIFRILLVIFFAGTMPAGAQSIRGVIKSREQRVLLPVPYATIKIEPGNISITADSAGIYQISHLHRGGYTIHVSGVGHKTGSRTIFIDSLDQVHDFILDPSGTNLGEVVVTGTMKEVSRLASPVPVEVYSSAFFRKNPTPSVFDALQNVNGVRPQLNCNICNTGDIHINGLEGPYTMILIDGMPIVSGLSSVYGLSGIPNFLIERIEIVKGPASSLYGSEAVGGLINIITKKPESAAGLSADVFLSTWKEKNIDLGLKTRVSDSIMLLTGINYFNYQDPADHNHDNFTDVTQQDRISVFQKWIVKRRSGKHLEMAGRFNYEDRWGGETAWNRSHRGGDEMYGESIYTNRWEIFGTYQLPLDEPLILSFSANDHKQNSVYGTTNYQARQRVLFGQLTWNKRLNHHDLLFGSALRRTYYDDNTTATMGAQDQNMPEKVWLPGVFFQDEIRIDRSHTLLAGFRYDYNSVHKHILTPRLAFKWSLNENNVLRANVGTGFRVVSLFTEEHAAISGSREVLVTEGLKPERSYNVNLNYIRRMPLNNGDLISLDASIWYTHFNNQIIPDYDSDPEKIIYGNLSGYAVSRGVSANLEFSSSNLSIMAGLTLMDVFSRTKGQGKERPQLSERWTGTWTASYKLPGSKMSIDYTGNIYGPMRLPILGDYDPRSPTSPVWSIQNLQLSRKSGGILEVYAGVKNLLNWTPGANEPFLIARSNDPFDKDLTRDTQGNILRTPSNPYGLSFDPAYVYSPNQGIRGYIGLRMNIR